jgi:hypothetical protein
MSSKNGTFVLLQNGQAKCYDSNFQGIVNRLQELYKENPTVEYPTYRSRALNQPAHADWREAWKALYAHATAHMTEVVRTDVTYLP